MIKQIKKLVPSSLKSRLRSWVIGHDIHTYYFAQSGEDCSLHALFSEILKTNIAEYSGYYVDIGAYDPVKFSNTYFFYINGWKGINVDPRPGSKNLFDKIRPRDLNIETGISLSEGTLTYYFIDDRSTLNTFSKEFIDEYKLAEYVKKEIPIKTITLSSLLKKHLPAGQAIDLLNIDTEGMDLEILQSNDWEQFRPKVLSIEISPVSTLKEVIEHETTRFLTERGYVAVGKNFIIKNTSTVIFADQALLK